MVLDQRGDAASTPRARWAPASSAAWPRRSRSTTSPRSAPPTSATPPLGLSHVLYAKSPGGVVASARRTAHWRPIVDRVARAHGLDADMLEAIVMLESAGRADARASDDLRSAVGPDPDPRRDRPEPARPAHRRQGVRAAHARHPARRAACSAARGAAPARRRALRPGQGDRGDGALPGLRQGQARPRRPRRRLLPHGRRQPAAGAHGLRQGRRPLRPAVLRLEPAAPRGGVAQAGVARRRLLDLPVARARGPRDHAPVPRRPRGPPARGGAAVAQGLGRGGPAPARAHAGLRRPLRDRPRAGVGRAARRSTGRSSRPTG